MRMLSIGLTDLKSVVASDMAEINFVATRLLPIEAILIASGHVLDGLERISQRWSHHLAGPVSPIQDSLWSGGLFNERNELVAYRSYLHVLMQKCSNVSKLLDGILNFRQSSHVLLLTTSTVDDSATVRVITVITLVFLSFTAVAVSPFNFYSQHYFPSMFGERETWYESTLTHNSSGYHGNANLLP